MVQNRAAIKKDTMKNGAKWGLSDEKVVNEAMRALADILINNNDASKSVEGVGALAAFLDHRMCVPRDMGAMSAASIKQLAYELYEQ